MGGAYQFEGRDYGSHEPVTVFHNTRLESLVQSTPDQNDQNWNPWSHEPVQIGFGILIDQRLYYGTGTHGKRSGVNVNVDGSWTFENSTGWVALECDAVGLAKLRHSWKKYCVQGPAYHKCFKVALKALWVPVDELPDFIFLTG